MWNSRTLILVLTEYSNPRQKQAQSHASESGLHSDLDDFSVNEVVNLFLVPSGTSIYPYIHFILYFVGLLGTKRRSFPRGDMYIYGTIIQFFRYSGKLFLGIPSKRV